MLGIGAPGVSGIWYLISGIWYLGIGDSVPRDVGPGPWDAGRGTWDVLTPSFIDSDTSIGVYLKFARGYSSVGRALEWHSRGQGFESP